MARPLCPGTWDDFARLVEANNGVWGGCWCMGFHPEGVGKGHTAAQNRDAKQAHVRNGTVHQILVYDGHECVGWCQYGRPVQLAEHQRTRTPTPRSWPRSLTGGSAASSPAAGTVAMGSHGLASAPLSPPSRRLAVGSSRLTLSKSKGVTLDRGAYFHTGPANLFEELGFERDRKIAKWRWVMRLRIRP